MPVNQGTSPFLNTPLIQPLNQLEETFKNQQAKIDTWFNDQWQTSAPPLYGSVDLRNAGFKLAPIDMNLFPAGFNNLNPEFFSLAVAAAKEALLAILPSVKEILLIPEGHTRNLFYWENIAVLLKILNDAGFAVRLGGFLEEAVVITLESSQQLQIEPLLREGNKLKVENFIPDLILLNNDLSEGIPAILQNLVQPVVPPTSLGWSERLKSVHFKYYAEVAEEFSTLLAFDPWLITPLFRYCAKVDFMQEQGLDCVKHHAQQLFEEIKRKYEQYHIPHQPFLIVKADAGTYGMAVMTLRDLKTLDTLNRKQRTRMSSTKGGQAVNRVIIQEGIYSFESVGEEGAVAEPVAYLWGRQVVGGFYRINKSRSNDENLNSPGMHFTPIAFNDACDKPCHNKDDQPKNHFYAYGMIAKLSMLAAAREMKDQIKRVKA
ncbi:MAG: glutamate--cysteine ligase [Gammaproteobacteria bacterium]|nr:glutamate--cysteine ligase [Gammaproteobacteria bacterium]